MTQTNQPNRRCAEEYTVKRGDSFYLIAHKLGVPLRDLLAAKKEGRVPQDYMANWGLEDEKVYAWAKEELALLAAGDQGAAGIVRRVDRQDVLTGAHEVRDVEAEGDVAALVGADRFVIEEHLRLLIGCADVQDHTASVKAFRKNEIPAIPQKAAIFIVLSDGGKSALWAKRYTDLSLIFIVHIEIPCAI